MSARSVAVSSVYFHAISHCRSFRLLDPPGKLERSFVPIVTSFLSIIYPAWYLGWKKRLQRFRLTQPDWYLDCINQTSLFSVYKPSHLDLIVDLLQSIILTTFLPLPSNSSRFSGLLPLSLKLKGFRAAQMNKPMSMIVRCDSSFGRQGFRAKV